jgi:membrane associated rhomboid family serine protease
MFYSVIGMNVIVYILMYILLPASAYTHFVITSESLRDSVLSLYVANFSHGGIIHLTMNMGFVYYFAQNLHHFYTKVQCFVLFYITALPIGLGMFAYVTFVSPETSVLGYSGVCFAILGAMFPHFKPQKKKEVVIQMALYHGVVLMAGLPVAWYGHLFGFIVGWSFYHMCQYQKRGAKKTPPSFRVL